MSFVRQRDPGGTRDDLEFVPVENPDPHLLTHAEISSFNERGFVEAAPILSATEADELRRYIDDLLRTVIEADDNRNAYSINTYHVVCQRLHDLVTDPRFTRRAADLLGDEIVCWGSHLFAKMPDDGKEVPVHQDGVYWPLTPSRSVTIWLAIDDVDEHNAPMLFVPGSHVHGPLDHVQHELDGTRVLDREVDPESANGLSRFGPERHVNTMPAGWASMHSDLLLHGSAVNRSSRRRAGLTLRYTAASTRLLDGYDYWRKSAVHVEAGDPADFWYDRPRPEGENPEKMENFWGEFDGQPLPAG